ncbi:hypothetical protein BTUL_0105g00060 [Botrytis tulipae]|uniref:Uncharacterized protein n=1 Tax=Botrytis tulipae TaxID=87230 RepID=A0A4Z1EH22_9HELO|nr:hypothetical protein BTUL_0105g00060 [Botrytis tulipae]
MVDNDIDDDAFLPCFVFRLSADRGRHLIGRLKRHSVKQHSEPSMYIHSWSEWTNMVTSGLGLNLERHSGVEF